MNSLSSKGGFKGDFSSSGRGGSNVLQGMLEVLGLQASRETGAAPARSQAGGSMRRRSVKENTIPHIIHQVTTLAQEHCIALFIANTCHCKDTCYSACCHVELVPQCGGDTEPCLSVLKIVKACRAICTTATRCPPLESTRSGHACRCSWMARRLWRRRSARRRGLARSSGGSTAGVNAHLTTEHPSLSHASHSVQLLHNVSATWGSVGHRLLAKCYTDGDIIYFATVPCRWRDSCQRCHPAWKHMFWDKAAAEQLLEERYPWFLETWRMYPRVVHRGVASRVLCC